MFFIESLKSLKKKYVTIVGVDSFNKENLNQRYRRRI